MQQMKAAEINVGLKGFEKVKAIRLSAEAFTLDNDCLTPTLKLKRSSVKRVRENQTSHLSVYMHMFCRDSVMRLMRCILKYLEKNKVNHKR